MQLGKLMANERELILRSLAFCGIRVVVPISNGQGRFTLSEIDLQEQEIKEIHLLSYTGFPGITEPLDHIGFVLKTKVGEWSIFVPKETLLHEGSFDGVFKVGHVIILNGGFVGEPSGTKAFIYLKQYNGICLITENGKTLGFNIGREEHENMIFIKDSGLKYIFENSEKMQSDWKNGLFKEAFK